MDRNVYRCEVRRDRDWWIIDIPAIRHVTQAETRAEVEEMAREAASRSGGG